MSPEPPNDQAFFSNLAMSGNTAVWTEEHFRWHRSRVVHTLSRPIDRTSAYRTYGRFQHHLRDACNAKREDSRLPQAVVFYFTPEGDLFVVDLP